jgi:hypothetical protein
LWLGVDAVRRIEGLPFWRLARPGILKRDGSVEDGFAGFGVDRVEDDVGETFELVGRIEREKDVMFQLGSSKLCVLA